MAGVSLMLLPKLVARAGALGLLVGAAALLGSGVAKATTVLFTSVGGDPGAVELNTIISLDNTKTPGLAGGGTLSFNLTLGEQPPRPESGVRALSWERGPSCPSCSGAPACVSRFCVLACHYMFVRFRGAWRFCAHILSREVGISLEQRAATPPTSAEAAELPPVNRAHHASAVQVPLVGCPRQPTAGGAYA
jgi:hypothetical protein